MWKTELMWKTHLMWRIELLWRTDLLLSKKANERARKEVLYRW